MLGADLRVLWECYGPPGGLLPASGVVLLEGLQARPELNGAAATVLSWDAASGSFVVSVTGRDRICARPENLKTPQDTAQAFLRWSSLHHRWLLPADVLQLMAPCSSERDVSALSACSRGARAAICLDPAAGPLWEHLLLSCHGPSAMATVRRARPLAAGPSLCRCARALGRLFLKCLEAVPDKVLTQAGGAEVVACPVERDLGESSALYGFREQQELFRDAGPDLEAAVSHLDLPLELGSVALVPGGPVADHVALACTRVPDSLIHGGRLKEGLDWFMHLHGNLFRAVRESGCRSLAMPTLFTGFEADNNSVYVHIAAIRSLHQEFCEHPTDILRVRMALRYSHTVVFKLFHKIMAEQMFHPWGDTLESLLRIIGH